MALEAREERAELTAREIPIETTANNAAAAATSKREKALFERFKERGENSTKNTVPQAAKVCTK
jgi:hypothetical protein